MKSQYTIRFTRCDCCGRSDDPYSKKPRTTFDDASDWDAETGIDICDECKEKYYIEHREDILSDPNISEIAIKAQGDDMPSDWGVVEYDSKNVGTFVKWL